MALVRAAQGGCGATGVVARAGSAREAGHCTVSGFALFVLLDCGGVDFGVMRPLARAA